MEKTVLGKSNLKSARLGFGGIPLQRVNADEAARTVNRSIELGVNFFDSARAYTVSESFIGQAIRDRRKDIILASKASAHTKGQWHEQVAISLKEFGTSYIDLYQIHNLKTSCEVDAVFQPATGSYEGFLQSREKGEVLHFGLTSHKTDVLLYALEKYGGKIETIMFPYNIVENQGVEMFRKAKRLNIGTIAMKPLAGGNIDDIPLAMRYTLDNDFIDIAIPGVGSVEEAEQDFGISVSPLTREEHEQCAQIALSLGGDFCRRCGYCGPCSAGIDIPTVFVMQNYVRKYNLKDWASARYNALSKRAEDCIACGLCEPRCPYGLKIMQRLRDAAEELK